MTVTVRDIARLAGVSHTTVLRALNESGRINEDTKNRIRELADKLGYIPNALARGLACKRSNAIGLIITDIKNPLYAELARGVEDIASDNGFHVVICNTDNKLEKEMAYITMLQELRVAGSIVSLSDAKSEHFFRLRNSSYPFVMLDDCPGIEVDYVTFNDRLGAYELAKYLLSEGHRSFAIVTSEQRSSYAVQQRLEGCKKAFDEKGLNFGTIPIIEDRLDLDSGYDCAARVLENMPRPTAVICLCDILAIGLIRGLFEAGIKIPEDMSVVGFDDIDVSKYLIPSLTSIALPKYELGVKAMEALLAVIQVGDQDHRERRDNECKQVLIEPQLIIRESSSTNMGAD
jgi:DNA-binding LacI/PurR family transcriptional regulator